MSYKKILTIDFSLTGSAFIWGDITSDKLGYSYFSDKKKDYENNSHCQKLLKEYTSDDKLDYIISYYINLLDKEGINYIFLESPSYNSVNTNDAFKEGYGLIKYYARQNGIKYQLIPPITSKLYFTGNARAEKQDMINQAVNQFGKQVEFETISKKHQEDIADALSLYSLGVDYFSCTDLGHGLYFQTGDIKHYDFLPPHRKMVVAKLYNRQDLYKQADKERKTLQF